MFKRTVVFFMIASMLITFVTSGNVFSADGYSRNGFHLSVLESDSTGIEVDTEFILETQKDFTLEQIKAGFSIDGEPSPIIDEMDDRLFSINLSRPLLENSIYTFRMKADTETTWVFQTRSSFKVTGSLPANQAVNIPVNTGIEINLSHEGFGDISDLFEITPEVKGRFEIHKKTAVFVPDWLDYETVYTVKLKKGLTLNGTNRKLEDDYVFSFETAPKEPPTTGKFDVLMSYGRQLYEYAPEDIPEITINYYTQNAKNSADIPKIKVNTDIYAYKDFNSFLDHVQKKYSVPTWAQVNFLKNLIEVDGLEKVLEFDEVINDTSPANGQKVISIPQKLPAGYYLVDSSWEDKRLQTLIQVTNTTVYIAKSTNKSIVWLNDLSNQLPISGAEISFTDTEERYFSDKEGIAYFDTLNLPKQDGYYLLNNQFMVITTADGKKSLLDCSSYGNSSNENYWKYFFTDRSMYKPDDTINFWGFVKNRYKDEEINYLTLEINQNYSSGFPVIKQNIDVKDGFFEASAQLRNLPKGYYYIRLKKGDTVLITSNIRVEDYIKPAYKMDISQDKKAIFLGETVNFDIKTSFFEGTPVSGLKVNYSIDSYSLNTSTLNTNNSTDTKGNLRVPYTPTASGKVQDENSASISARALLPESGSIQAASNVRVFVNDISVRPKGQIKNGIGTITTQVNKIVLDRLNDGTAKDYSDYLGSPVAGKEIRGTIYKNTWVKYENGTYYDYINKLTHKTYSYKLLTEPLRNFSCISSADGTASYSFDAPEIEDTYYSADVNCVDSSGRSMSYNIYIGKFYDYSSYEYKTYNLKSNKASYVLGDNVELSFNHGKEPLPEGKYIYYKAQNGIYDYTTSTKPYHSFEMGKTEIPNSWVIGVYFNGRTYIKANCQILYNYEERKLTIEAKTDKDSYKPGEQAVISISVKDAKGKPVKASVNTSIVDEAFFKLANQNVNLLGSIYSAVYTSVFLEATSHNNSNNISIYRYGWDKNIYLANSPSPSAAPSSEGGSDSDVREDFKDTARFVTVMTDSNGKANVSFKLPDNITAWRVTLSALSNDLYAGSDKINMNVTLPFFINYSFNTVYVEGDKPVLGVNAYGNGLTENEPVTFEVSNASDPNQKLTASGKAFERVNIPLWALEEGNYDLIIRAYTANGLSDAVKHSVNVVKSYYEIDKAEYSNLAPGINIAGGTSGNTRLVFQDRSKGMFLSQLINLYYSYGNRIDQVVSRYTASKLISQYFEGLTYTNNLDKPYLTDYQKDDGGLSLLPYSESDIDISAKLAVLAKDMVNTTALKNYFYGILDNGDNTGRAKALYGLSVLKEPVVLELDKTALLDNLSIKDVIYVALSYYELGDSTKAGQLYDERISKYIVENKPYFIVKTGDDKDDILETTSLCSILAAKLDKAEKSGLYEYCTRNYAMDILLSTEKLMFISEEIGGKSTVPASFSYSFNGEEKNISLENGYSHCINLLSSQMKDFSITKVQGDISVVSIFKENVVDINKVDPDISITRSYLLTDGTPVYSNEFKQGDLIRVRLDWSFGSQSFDGTYEITDYLPAGLQPYNRYLYSDGQKISFYAYNSPYWNTNRHVEYLARVISPGTYTALGPVIQGKTSQDNINVGKTEIVTIKTNGDITNPSEVTPPPSPAEITLGDLNGDSKVNSTDYSYLRRYLLGLIDKLPVDINNADLNGDGKVNSTDYAILKRYLLGTIEEFPR